jgi:hypothetical protein
VKDLKAREIFATGTHNGDRYTIEDLDAMVEAYHELDFKPALKAGHSEKPGELALGWVSSLRRVGDKLIADFSNIPDNVYELINSKAYDRVSAEVFWDFERAGKTFKRALKAVALLGAEIPGVAGLKPLSASFAGTVSAKAYTVSLDPHNQARSLAMDPKELQDKIDAAAKKAADEATAKLEAKYKAENEAREKRYAEERAADAKRLADLEAQRAAEAIESAVKRCTLPALHSHLRVFATLAFAQTGDAAAKKYALGKASDGKAVEATALEAFNALVDEINTKGTKLFLISSKTGERKTEGDYDASDRESVDAEVERRAKALKAKSKGEGKEMSISAAQDAVFAADAELAKAYSQVHQTVAA